MANTLKVIMRSAQLSLLKAPTTIKSHKLTLLQPELVRSLYSKSTLGLDGFNEQRERVKNQMINIADKFKEKMTEYTKDDSKNMIFTEDLKNMVHLAENEQDLELSLRMMKRFNQQNKQLRFGSYIFGPVVMRMLYVFNKPELALETFKSPEMEGFFDQLITYQILLDLLYENQRYQDIIECFNIIKDRQIEGTKYPRNIAVLTFAACYKLNSKESLKIALDIWKQLTEIGHLPMRRAVTFCAGLALAQGEPAIALEILSTAKNQNYTTVRNIKVAALVDIGRIEDALPILKSVISEDKPHDGKTVHTFNRDVINKVKAAVAKSENPDVTLEYNRLEEFFNKQGHISEVTLDEQLCLEIQKPPVMNNDRQGFNNFGGGPRNNFQNNSRNQYQQQDGRFNRPQRSGRFVPNRRPGLEDLV